MTGRFSGRDQVCVPPTWSRRWRPDNATSRPGPGEGAGWRHNGPGEPLPAPTPAAVALEETNLSNGGQHLLP